MYMIEIEESKLEKMTNLVDDMLHCGGRLMHYLEDLEPEESEEDKEEARHSYRRTSRY